MYNPVDTTLNQWKARFDIPRVKNILESIQLEKNTDKISEWAPKNRSFPSGTPFPGPWENERTIYTVEIMDELSPSSDTEVVTVLKAAQIGLTAGSAENLLGFKIDVDPGQMLYVTADEDLATFWSENRFEVMLESCGLMDRFESAVKKKGGRSTGNKTLSKSFRGGNLLIASYRQASKLRSSSFQIVIFDEVDAAPQSVGVEGDPRKIGEARTSNYEKRKKILIISTPLIKATSQIWQAFQEGDQRYFHMPCPDCGEPVTFRLLDDAYNCRLKYDVKKGHDGQVIEDSVYFPCPHCEFKIKDYHKSTMYNSGKCEWIPTNPDALPRNRSYFADGMLSPIGGLSWEKLAQEFVSAVGDDAKMRAYVTLRGAMPWEETGEVPSVDDAKRKRGGYKRGQMNNKIIMTTCGGDLHKDRLDVEILGTDGRETWSIDWRHYAGAPTCTKGGSLYNFMRDFEDGTLPGKPQIGFVDSGYKTEEVYRMSVISKNLHAVKGEDWINTGAPFAESTLKQYGGMKFIRINTGLLKGRIMTWLRLKPYEDGDFPAGYPHFPSDYEDAYFDQITSEARFPVEDSKTGRILKYRWMPIHAKGNHALDCRVYAMAAIEYRVFLLAKMLGLEENYEQLVWECLKDPEKLAIVMQATI